MIERISSIYIHLRSFVEDTGCRVPCLCFPFLQIGGFALFSGGWVRWGWWWCGGATARGLSFFRSCGGWDVGGPGRSGVLFNARDAVEITALATVTALRVGCCGICFLNFKHM